MRCVLLIHWFCFVLVLVFMYFFHIKSTWNAVCTQQQVNSDSDISLVNYDYKSSKTNLKGRLSDMFRRSASLSRNDSEDGAAIESDNRNSKATGAYSRSTTPNLSSSRHKSPATIRPVQVSVQLSLAVRTNIERRKKAHTPDFSIRMKT